MIDSATRNQRNKGPFARAFALVQFEQWHGRPARDHAQDARATSNRTSTLGCLDTVGLRPYSL